MASWIRSIFGAARPSGTPQSIRQFRTSDPTLSQSCITPDQDGWVIAAGEGQTVRLFEIVDPLTEACLLTYRARVKTEGLVGCAYLEMWCRLPGRGEFFSKGVNQAMTGWALSFSRLPSVDALTARLTRGARPRAASTDREQGPISLAHPSRNAPTVRQAENGHRTVPGPRTGM